MTGRTERRPVALVTGHDGFIGAALMAALPGLGWQPQGLTEPDGAPVDLRDAQAVTGAVLRIDPEMIFHMGGVSGPMQFVQDARTVLRVNIEGTQTLLEAARRTRVRRIVLAGSVAGYATPGPSGPEPDNVYGITKRVAELQAHLWARQTGREATVLRIGSVYGPGRLSANPMHEMVSQAQRSGRIRVAPHLMEPCIDIRSCAALIARLANVPVLRPRYDVVADRPAAEQVASIIAELTGAQVEICPGPGPGAPAFPEAFDAAPLVQDTEMSAVLSLRDGLKALTDAAELAG
ncbi:NAD-dependent epimerase/dehydratase family protein [Mangrovicoccus ximenensis]|uniref:NAD-dependent epimerase/dehydratase family protein n=1 Tax=Mangrovicoccus ximenensis TaxID=1911570 RepID=UPI000D336957|nr:NAD(P)-dependent oxidoreductase [Mangrovicoccus ximenensis]